MRREEGGVRSEGGGEDQRERTLVTLRRASPSVCENISDREMRESECV